MLKGPAQSSNTTTNPLSDKRKVFFEFIAARAAAHGLSLGAGRGQGVARVPNQRRGAHRPSSRKER